MTNIIEIVDGQLTTNSEILAKELGFEHNLVGQRIRVLIRDGALMSDDISCFSYLTGKCKERKVYVLNERDLLVAMLHFGRGRKQLRIDFVDEYLLKSKKLKAVEPRSLNTYLKSFYYKVKGVIDHD